jgi:hypothetical protein
MAKPKPSQKVKSAKSTKSADQTVRRSDPIPVFGGDFDEALIAPVARGDRRRPLPPYLPSLLWPPYEVDDFDDPECTGVHGQPSFSAPWTDDDTAGIPIITDFLKKSYNWQIECWERECREKIAKYGCSIDPRDPVPPPLPDEATEVEKDARRLVVAAQGLKRSFHRFCFFDAVIFAIDLGSLKRKLESRWADGFVDRGRKHRAGGKRGGDSRQAAERDNWESWRKEANEFRKKYPQIKSKRELAKLIHNRHTAPGDPLAGTIEAIRKKI